MKLRVLNRYTMNKSRSDGKVNMIPCLNGAFTYYKDVAELFNTPKHETVEECTWVRSFDQHFNIGCVNETGERANGNFRGKDKGAKWEFIYCPYCGKEIVEGKPEIKG